IARTAEDLRLLFDAMGASGSNQKDEHPQLPPREGPPRLGRLRGYFDLRANEAVSTALGAAIGALTAQGADLVEVDDPVDFEQVLLDHRRVMAAEAAGVHSDGLSEFPDDYPPRIRDLILEGRSLTALEYLKAKNGMSPATQSIVDTVKRAKLD